MNVTREFKAVERDDEHLWVELMEGEKKGLQYAIPDVEDMEIGEVRELTVAPKNDKKTAWKVVDC